MGGEFGILTQDHRVHDLNIKLDTLMYSPSIRDYWLIKPYNEVMISHFRMLLISGSDFLKSLVSSEKNIYNVF